MERVSSTAPIVVALAYPASITGWFILKSLVRGVSNTLGEEGILLAERICGDFVEERPSI